MSRRRVMLWFAAGIASVVLLAVVIAQIDPAAARQLAGTIDYRWVAAGVVVLLIEGVLTAMRFRLLARGAASLRACLLTTAWYVLMLIGLPARLGEVAGIALIVRYLGQSAGVATASLLLQRVFDMLVLIALLVLVALLAFAGEQLRLILIASAGLAALLAAVVVFFESILGALARPLVRRRREKWPALVLRLLLQARIYSRHYMNRARVLKLALLTGLKWSANLIGIALVVLAVVPDVAAPTALGLGIVYNLSAVIPLQTIGGFGISEVVLLGSFRWLGYAVGVGAPIAIAIRLALLSAPVVFWVLVVSFTATLARARMPDHAV